MRKRDRKRKFWTILGIVFAVLLVLFICFVVFKYAYETVQYTEKEDQYIRLRQRTEKIIVSEEAPGTSQAPEGKLPLGGRTYDFDALREENKDIIAWLYLPDTEIDYPVFRNEDNTFYLEHNMDGSRGKPGCLYMENYNRADFSDSLNVIYGHNMRNGTMFGSMKEFRGADYFKAHRSIYLYTPEGDQEYRIIAVGRYPDDHIFADRITVDDTGSYVFNGMTGDEAVNFMKNLLLYGDDSTLYGWTEERTVRKGDRLLVLSTCDKDREKRLLIVGKLIDDTN